MLYIYWSLEISKVVFILLVKIMRIIKKSTEKLLIESFKDAFKKIANNKSKQNRRLSFVLTGGPSPINLYRNLNKLKIDWSNIDFFWGDERYVSENSKHSNYFLVKKNLFNFINIKNKQVFSINTKNKSPKICVFNYNNKIRKYFKTKKISFDIFLLGMGNDGHVASIFPNKLDEKSNKISRYVKRDDFKRISINLKVINNSKKIFLWLNTKKSTKNFSEFRRKKKKVPVNYLNKKITTVFSII